MTKDDAATHARVRPLPTPPAQGAIVESWSLKHPVVSVLVPTYNHVDYIKNCLNGILCQQTTFPFEVLIRDDASSDGTSEVIDAYRKDYCDLVRVVRNKVTLYPQTKPLPQLQPYARGKYVAVCEGDDYWVSPFKLQRQADFLEAHPQFVATAHSNLVLADGIVTAEEPPNAGRLRQGDLLPFLTSLPPLALMFRNSSTFPIATINRATFGDTVIKAWLCSRGDAFVDTSYFGAVHLIHSKGVFSGASLADQLSYSAQSLMTAAEFLNQNGNVDTGREAALMAIEALIRQAEEVCGPGLEVRRQLGSRWLRNQMHYLPRRLLRLGV